MRPLISILIGLVILSAALGTAIFIVRGKEEPKAETPPPQLLAVRILTVQKQDVPLEVPSQGVVEPWSEARLASEVAGRVVSISPNLEVGADVASGEFLVQIDPTDYEAALQEAKARVADAKLAVANEEAAAAQAMRDWKRLGTGGEPPPLAARIPQLEAARGALKAAEAAVQRAETNLRRTRITAPFEGRISAKLVEVGTVVAPGTPVAEMFATSTYKVRLPLSLDDSARVFRPDGRPPKITLTSSAGGLTANWTARFVRSEGEVDRRSRSIYFVAEVAPEGITTGGMKVPLLPGIFLQANIEGQTIPDAVVVPRQAFPDQGHVLVLDEDNILHRRDVQIAWAGRRHVVVSGGLENGERVCLTTVEGFIDGKTQVQPEEDTGTVTQDDAVPPKTTAPSES